MELIVHLALFYVVKTFNERNQFAHGQTSKKAYFVWLVCKGCVFTKLFHQAISSCKNVRLHSINLPYFVK